jgi:hypothetical protein
MMRDFMRRRPSKRLLMARIALEVDAASRQWQHHAEAPARNHLQLVRR